MTSAGTRAVPADAAPDCRREVYDALAAADGVLSAAELRKNVEPHLVARVGGEIALAGGFDPYLDEKLALFTADGMLTVAEDGTVTLVDGFELRVRDGKMRYVPGTQRAVDYIREVDQLVLALRRVNKGAWDCLLPQSNTKERKKTVQDSLETFGWDEGRPVIKDRTGQMIDGRMRYAEFQKIHPNGPPMPNGKRRSWAEWGNVSANIRTEASLTPALGLIRSFDENRHRCSAAEITEYLDKLAGIGIDFDRLRDAIKIVAQSDTSGLGGAPLKTVTLTSGLQVTTDGLFVQLRSLVAGPLPLQSFDAKNLRNYLNDHGYVVVARQASNISGGKGTLGRVADFGYLTDLIELIGEDSGSALCGVWPKAKGKHTALTEKLPMLLEAADEVKRIVASV